jgi:CBS domain containing-hemolysin-like protein
MIAFILTVSISLGITCLCSILEAVLLSLSHTDVAKMSGDGPRSAAIWGRLKKNIHQPIAVILIVNTFAHTIGASLSGAQFDRIFGHEWVIVYSIGYSLVMIQWTEILPKSLAVMHNRRFAGWFALPMDMMMKIFAPAVFIVDLMNKPFAPKKDDPGKVDTLDDISILAHFASTNKIITDRQEELVERSLALSSVKVRDIMVGRDEMKCLVTDMSLAEALIEAHIHHHTRFPLLEKGSGEFIGYVNFKDIVSALQLNPRDPSLRGICRPMISIDEAENLSALLGRLMKSYSHISLVRDAAGRVTGVVTLEDVIESIVGEINDEYDILPDYLYQIAENRYVAGGGISFDRLIGEVVEGNTHTGQTLNDFIFERLGRTPKAEDALSYLGVTFSVRKVRRCRVHEAVVAVR